MKSNNKEQSFSKVSINWVVGILEKPLANPYK